MVELLLSSLPSVGIHPSSSIIIIMELILPVRVRLQSHSPSLFISSNMISNNLKISFCPMINNPRINIYAA